MPRAKTIVPSSTILSLLSSFAAGVDTPDSPPDFLCPTLLAPRQNIPKAPTKPKRSTRRNPVVEKYERDEEGVWRRVSEYTLYGTKVCPDCDTEASNGVQIDKVASPSTPVLAQITNYPAGWAPSVDTTRQDLPAIIMALSIALAILVCVFTISCIFWRKGRPRKRRTDVESKERRRGSGDKEREYKHKQQLWARATARWRSNVRHTARKRRADMTMRTSIITPTPQPSRPSTRQPSPAPTERPPTPLEQPPTATSSQRAEESTTTLPVPITSSPPAYHHPPDASSSSSRQPTSENYAGHIATDDKVVLAQRAELINAPEFSLPPSVTVSAPEWHDERLEDFDHDGVQDGLSPDLPFPPPPEPVASSSKGQMAAFEQQYANFPEYTDAEPEYGPSAPPFESVGPSAPPIDDDDVMLLASAPPAQEDSDEDDATESRSDDEARVLNPLVSLDGTQRLDNG